MFSGGKDTGSLELVRYILSQKLLELLEVANFVGGLDGAGLSFGVEVYLVYFRSLEQTFSKVFSLRELNPRESRM